MRDFSPKGLNNKEVYDRQAHGLANEEVNPSTKTVEEIVKSNIFTYFNLIFTILAVLLIFAGSFKDLTFMLIIFANTGIGIYQELKSKKILDNLRFSKMPRSCAIRNGIEIEVPTEELVRDDLVILRAGNQIPGDGILVYGSINVNEAMITGESDEIEKKPGDNIFSGSFVISGDCVAQLTAVGAKSYINKLTLEATKQKKHDNKSQMVRSLDKLVMVIGIAIIPIGLILLFQQFWIQNLPFRDSVISMVAAVLGMIPEGLYMMTSIAMVVSAMRLAKKEVLVQNMRCIETLARVDVLCVDKTGTITENRMKVAGIKVVDESYSEDEVEKDIGNLAKNQSKDNITMEALQDYFSKESARKLKKVCGFSSKYKYCGVVYSDVNHVLGAPEYILGDAIVKYEEYIKSVAQQGYRVLAFGESKEEPKGQSLSKGINLIAFIFLSNPIRNSAKDTFKYFKNNGVDIKVISGDNPVTVSNISGQAGIASSEKYIDASSLKTQADIDDAIEKYTIFGRVTPEQKRMFVKGLQSQGNIVGMTGDGVNDILALRDADISIAMASGSEAASNAAQLVLMDSDFGKMPLVVAEGRRVVNNIIKTATLYLTKNIFSLLLALFSLISVFQYPLKPSQITLISMFAIGLPSFVLSLEPNEDKIKGSFLGNVFRMATPAGITLFLSVSGLLIFGNVLSIESNAISTASSALVALVEFMILARVAQPMNKLHLGMMIVMITGFFYMIIFHNAIFGISKMDWQCALLLVVFMLATEAVFRYFYIFTTTLENIFEKYGAFQKKRGKNKRTNKRRKKKKTT